MRWAWRCVDLWNDLGFSLCAALSVCCMATTLDKRKKSNMGVSTDLVCCCWILGIKFNKSYYVTNFIQLVSPQPVDLFSQTKLCWKSQISTICIYMRCIKTTTNNWDIRLSVAVKALSANISWMAERICTVKLALESAHQSIYNDI